MERFPEPSPAGKSFARALASHLGAAAPYELGMGRSAAESWTIETSGCDGSLLLGWSPAADELITSCVEGLLVVRGLRAAKVSSVTILLASADARLTSTGSRCKDELLLSLP